jgi:hypothetical protein
VFAVGCRNREMSRHRPARSFIGAKDSKLKIAERLQERPKDKQAEVRGEFSPAALGTTEVRVKEYKYEILPSLGSGNHRWSIAQR